MPGTDDDSIDFSVPDPGASGTKTQTQVMSSNPLRSVLKAETGASVMTMIHDPSRKGNGYPNEDTVSAKNITLDGKTTPEDLLRKVVNYVADTNRSRDDGTTLAASIVTNDKLYTATMGDSPVFVVTYDPSAGPDDKLVEVKQINKDHVASDPDERSKLPDPSLAKDARGNGRWRVYEDETSGRGIMITRAVGDRDFKLNQDADIQTYDLGADAKAGKISFVVSGSDGLMEGTSREGIEKMLEKMFRDSLSSTGQIPNSDEIAYHMVTHRFDERTGTVEEYRRNDDTSAVVQQVSQEQQMAVGGKQTAQLITTADGHGYKMERDADDKLVPKYDKLLSGLVVEQTERYVQSPNLMRDSMIRR
jgi:serine/threonine protein phosphatase PrpC